MTRTFRWLRALVAGAPLLAACQDAPGFSRELPVCQIVNQSTTLPTAVPEASGAALSRSQPGVIWSHNDSGGTPHVFAVNVEGRLLAQVLVAGAENVDWEGIALGPCGDGDCLYIADTGDNAGERAEVVIYRVPEPPADSRTRAAAEAFRVRYPEGPNDSEAIFVLPPDQIFLVTKGRDDRIEVFRYPGSPRTGEVVTLQAVRTLSTAAVPNEDRVTGADVSQDGATIAIRTNTSLLLYRTEDLVGDRDGEPARIDLAPLAEPQGEAVAMGANGTIYLLGEGGGGGAAGTLRIVQCQQDGE